MALQIKARGEFPSPLVVDYRSRAELRCLDDGFGFIDRALVVAVVPLEE